MNAYIYTRLYVEWRRLAVAANYVVILPVLHCRSTAAATALRRERKRRGNSTQKKRLKATNYDGHRGFFAIDVRFCMWLDDGSIRGLSWIKFKFIEPNFITRRMNVLGGFSFIISKVSLFHSYWNR